MFDSDVSIMYFFFLPRFLSMLSILLADACRDPLERENELRYSIDPSSNNSTSNGINRRTSMSVTDMSNLAAINNQQQRLCSVCCRRDVSFSPSLKVEIPPFFSKLFYFETCRDVSKANNIFCFCFHVVGAANSWVIDRDGSGSIFFSCFLANKSGYDLSVEHIADATLMARIRSACVSLSG